MTELRTLISEDVQRYMKSIEPRKAEEVARKIAALIYPDLEMVAWVETEPIPVRYHRVCSSCHRFAEEIYPFEEKRLCARCRGKISMLTPAAGKHVGWMVYLDRTGIIRRTQEIYGETRADMVGNFVVFASMWGYAETKSLTHPGQIFCRNAKQEYLTLFTTKVDKKSVGKPLSSIK